MSQDLNEADVLASVRAGEREAFADLVRRHTPVAHATAVLMGAGSDADDVVQEAFVKAYRSLGSFTAGAPFRPWLLRIVANETRNLHRSSGRRRRRELSDQAVAAFPPLREADPADQALTRERQERLRGVLLELPEQQRLVVICRYLLELDESETAAVLGIAKGTVKSRLHRALGRMRLGLADDPRPETGRES